MLNSEMAFGIKEVCDVAFYEVGTVVIGANGSVVGNPLLILDTLKVSNLENTAENSDARGGRGNAPLISWDYGREINVALQDAILSEDSLALMFENNVVDADNVIHINANTFPGVYTIVGKTYARDVNTGKDSIFTWYIPKAKVNSEVTLTMEAEGEPTIFDMNLRVLRDSDGTMVKMFRDDSRSDYNILAEFTGQKVEYTVAWNVNGTITTETYWTGDMPSFKGNTSRPTENGVEYTFIGWSPAISIVTGDVTYTAQYSEKRQYTITWKVEDKTYTSKHWTGEMPTFPESDSVLTKPEDTANELRYEFDGWSPALSVVTGDKTYTATFKAISTKIEKLSKPNIRIEEV